MKVISVIFLTYCLSFVVGGCSTAKQNKKIAKQVNVINAFLYTKYVYRSAYQSESNLNGFWAFNQKINFEGLNYYIIDPASVSETNLKCRNNILAWKYFKEHQIANPLLELENFKIKKWYLDTLTNDLYNVYDVQCAILKSKKKNCLTDFQLPDMTKGKFYCPSPPDPIKSILMIILKLIKVKSIPLEQAMAALNISTLKEVEANKLTFLECQ